MPSPVSGRRKSACSAAHHEVGGERQLEAAARRDPVDRRDDGLGAAVQLGEPGEPAGPLVGTGGLARRRGLEVPAGAEEPLAGRRHDPTRSSGSLAERRERLVQRAAGGRVDRVRGRPVERDLQDAAARLGPAPRALHLRLPARRSIEREMMCRWISLVPSQIRSTRASRQNRSTGQLAHQAHAAEDLHRLVGHPAEHLRGVQLGHRGVGVGHPALVQPPGGAEGQELGGLDLGRHVGEAEADALEPPDRLAELLAGRRPPGAQLQHPPGPPHAGRRHGEPARPEPLAQQVEPVPLGRRAARSPGPGSRRTTARSGDSRGGRPTTRRG